MCVDRWRGAGHVCGWEGVLVWGQQNRIPLGKVAMIGAHTSVLLSCKCPEPFCNSGGEAARHQASRGLIVILCSLKRSTSFCAFSSPPHPTPHM